jgi:predicted O-linked N-acetylglucosamine transferase (SPINDLY family)
VTRRDWATTAFEKIATQWHNVGGQNAQQLAQTIASQQLPALIDLCGWMDPTALKALSTRPAARQYKWVGGQSLSTGLDCFDGFISDEHHTPTGSQSLYTEPLLLVPGGYAGYHPPPYLPAPQTPPNDGRLHLGLVSNPAKASLGYLQHLRQHWPQWQAHSPLPLQLNLIDHRYQIPHLQQHMRTQLPGIDLQFVTPGNHAQYLQALGQLHAVLDTWPYSGGLTTLEAHSLGVPVYTHSQGQLFCERHSHAHHQLLGMPQPQISDPDFLPSHALQIDRQQLRLHAARRQDVRQLVNKWREILSIDPLANSPNG